MKNQSKLWHYSKREKKDFLFCYIMIALPVLQLIVFWFTVNIDSILLSFQDNNSNFTFNNFKDVFVALVDKDRYGFNLAETIYRSFSIWFIANVPVFLISLMTTYVLFRKVIGHYVFRVIYVLPSIVGAVVWTTIIKFLVANDGPIVEVLTKLNIQLPYQVIRNGFFGAKETAFSTVKLIIILLGIGGGNVVITSSYSRMPNELYDVGKLDGIGFWKEFWKIVLPCAWPSIATIITFSLCGIFTADGNVFLYSNGTGEPGMSTVGYYLYYMVYRINQSGNLSDFNYPAAVGLFITLISIPIVLLGRYLLNKLVETVEF